MFPLEQHTIFLTLAGSRAHGTARAGSDVDLRGVCIAPLPLRLSLFRAFEQHEGPLPEAMMASVSANLATHAIELGAHEGKYECVIFDIAKFVRLCATANPNALEILFADERDWVLAEPAWHRLHAERLRFLTRKTQQTFHGYAMAQLKKIRTHRSWLLNPPAAKPRREDFGLPATTGTLDRDDQNRIEQSVALHLRGYGIDDIEMPKSTRLAVQERLDAFRRDVLATSDEDLDQRMRAVATAALHLPPHIVAAMNAEKKYRGALKQWDAYQSWKSNRNPVRAELEQRHGYDTKHAMHLIRLMRMGVEILATGDLRVRRQDAADLVAIRDGALTFDELSDLAVTLQDAMTSAAATTSLPADIDHAAVDDLLQTLLLEPVR
jgi:predicted nucleotidyltransferase